MRILSSIILLLITATSALASDFVLQSSTLYDNKKIPILYTCNGKNISPPLSWNNIPARTKSFVLLFSTSDWKPTEVYLWTVYNISGDVKGLEQGADEDLPEGTLVGTTYYDDAKYHGPCPPDSLEHQYIFTLYALDTMLEGIEDKIDPNDLLTKIKPHILKKAELKVLFSH